MAISHATADEIRARNGFRVLVAAFATVIVAFCVSFYAWSHNSGAKIVAADVIALLGVVTGVVGTLVGSYFGVSAANSARDALGAQLGAANDARTASSSALGTATMLNTRLSAALAPDVARAIVDEHAAQDVKPPANGAQNAQPAVRV